MRSASVRADDSAASVQLEGHAVQGASVLVADEWRRDEVRIAPNTLRHRVISCPAVDNGERSFRNAARAVKLLDVFLDPGRVMVGRPPVLPPRLGGASRRGGLVPDQGLAATRRWRSYLAGRSSRNLARPHNAISM